MRKIFDSRDEEYKVPFGAVTDNQIISFKVYWPLKEEVLLTVFHENSNSTIHIYMKKQDNDEWSAVYQFNLPGIYFYRFESENEYIAREEQSSLGYISNDFTDKWFTQLVYSEGYKPPNGFLGQIIYQIFPDRFYHSKLIQTEFLERYIHQNLDEQPFYLPENGVIRNNDYYGGNLKGIEEKLPYLKELGVDVIYLNPILKSHSNHRYDTADYLKIDPMLGTNEDFVCLCKEANSFGIKIILDGVFSHTGADSIYFDRYGRYGGTGAYDNKDSIYRGWYNFNDSEIGYSCWWGFLTLPETNKESKSFREFICKEGGVIDYWLKQGASGFRLDVADELPDSFIKEIRKAVKRHGNDKILIGEVWENAALKISYDKRRQYLLGDELDSVMNYPFRTAILDFLIHADAEVFMSSVMEIIEHYPKPMMDVMMNLLSTHDTERLINALVAPSNNNSKEWQAEQKISHEDYLLGVELAKLAFTLLFTLPGIPTIYYGDEIGMTGYMDPFNRGYFKWNSIDYNILNFVKELSRKRKAYSAFKDGVFVPLIYENNVVAYLRTNKDSAVLIAVNRSLETIEIKIDDKTFPVHPWRCIIERIKGDTHE